jgi:hypothetical protein
VPEQAVIGGARQPVDDRIDFRSADAVEETIEGSVETGDLRAHR